MLSVAKMLMLNISMYKPSFWGNMVALIFLQSKVIGC